MQPRLTRSRTDRMIAGVCGGLGHYFGIDPVIVRLIFVVLAITTFITPLIYPVLWLIMPQGGQPQMPTMPLPPDARFDPMTGEPLPPQTPPAIGQTVNLHQATTPPRQPASSSSRSRTLGFLLLGIGAMVLINNVGDALARIFGVNFSNFLFPILLVGVGVYLLRRKTT